MNMNEKELERLLKALGNKRRLAILAYLKKVKESSVGEIASHIKLSLKATSKHLSVLYGIDALEKEQRSLNVFYRLNSKLPPIIKHVSNALPEYS